MHKPARAERLYIDFDGYFAAVEEQYAAYLHGKPVGVIPFENARNSCVISANAVAKRHGIRTGMGIDEARLRCPSIALVPQHPERYVSTQRRIVQEVLSITPVDAVYSIDELCCVLSSEDQAEDLGRRIKKRLRETVGRCVTCSMGFAPNRLLAKVASDMDKPDGLTVLHPSELPGRLLDLVLEDFPGIGKRMYRRLLNAGIHTVKDMWDVQPDQLHNVWHNVGGLRFWYALHGYELESGSTKKSSFGHGRVLPPDARSVRTARPMARLLVVKAARRLRREGFLATRLTLFAESFNAPDFSSVEAFNEANDDSSCLAVLDTLWSRLEAIRSKAVLIRIMVSFDRLVLADNVQLKLFDVSDGRFEMRKALSSAVDAINTRYGRTLVGYGHCADGADGYAGAKIAYGRIPEMEDFW